VFKPAQTEKRLASEFDAFPDIFIALGLRLP
jgi:hypothetical protein